MRRKAPSKEYWDARAEENALFFVDTRIDYYDPDEQQFWDTAAATLNSVLEGVGAEIRPEETVLDIGCGVGRLTRVIAERAKWAHGIDISPRMLALAREYNRHVENVTWHEGDGVSLAGIDSESMDACVSHVVFQHIPDPAVTLGYVREIGRVLRPGGWAVFQISNDKRVHDPGLRSRVALRTRLKIALGRQPRGVTSRNWLGSSIDLPDLRRAVDDGGMDLTALVGEGTQFCYARTTKRS